MKGVKSGAFCIALVAAFGLACFGEAYAQPQGGPARPQAEAPEGGPPPPPPGGDRRPDRHGPPRDGEGLGWPVDDNGREMLEALRIIKISEALKLDDEQTVILMRRFREMKERTETLHKERQSIMHELKQSIQSNAAESEIQQKLDALMAKEDETVAARREAFERAGEGLSALQRAKLYVFMSEFDSEMRKMIRQARQHPRDESGERREGERGDRRDGFEGDRRGPGGQPPVSQNAPPGPPNN